MATDSKENTWLVTSSLIVLAAVAIGFVLMFARSVLIPFVLSIFIVALVSPVLDFQVLKLKFARPVAVVITLLLVVVFITVVFILIGEAVQAVVETATRYNESLYAFINRVADLAERWGLVVNRQEILNSIGKQIPRMAKNFGGTALGFLSAFTLVTIFVIFLLAGRNPYIIRRGVYADIDQEVRRYIATKLSVSTATGILVWILLKLLGLQLAPVFGMLAFFLNFIPSIGSVIATFLPLPVAVAQFTDQWWMIVLVILLPGTVQMTIGNLIEPKIMGSGLNLHPVTILLSLAFWGLLWGIPGMFLAVPLTSTFRIVLRQFETLRPVADILAGVLPGSNNTTQDGQPVNA